MRTFPIAVAAFALLSSGAFAQTTQTEPSRSSPMTPAPSATTSPAKPAPVINPLTQEDVSQIEGNTVYGGDGAKVGHISTVLMDPATKKIDRLVVAAGGVLGIGSHLVAIPVEQFSWDPNQGAFKLSMDLASLKAKPEWVEGGTMTGSSQPSGDKTAPAGAGDGDSRTH
jgi:sporulation protein YlmC with PRC-barrel domain